jgi:hypothetical protein
MVTTDQFAEISTRTGEDERLCAVVRFGNVYM